MRKISLISIAMLIRFNSNFCGRSPDKYKSTSCFPSYAVSQAANTTGVDAALSNPAGLAFCRKTDFIHP